MESTPKAIKKYKIFIACGELSGDDIAGYFVHSLKSYIHKKNPNLIEFIEFYAIGANQLKNQNVPLFLDLKDFSVMGIFEILLSLPKLLKLRKKIFNFVIDWNCDLFIGVDSPDFYLPLEAKIKEKNIKTIHLVVPSVYAWRSYRLKKIAKSVDLLLGVLPFEKKFINNYADKNNFKLNYKTLTHPIYSDFLQIQKTPNEQIEKFKTKENKSIVSLFLGSRTQEIKTHLPTLVNFLKQCEIQYPNFVFISSTKNLNHHKIIQQAIDKNKLKNWYSQINNLEDLIQHCDFMISKSGTINLFAAKYKKPILIFYKMNLISFWIAKLLTHQNYASLLNFSLGKKKFVELIQSQFKVKNLLIEFKKLVDQPKKYDSDFEKINQDFQGKNQDDEALEKVYQLIEEKLSHLENQNN